MNDNELKANSNKQKADITNLFRSVMADNTEVTLCAEGQQYFL